MLLMQNYFVLGTCAMTKQRQLVDQQRRLAPHYQVTLTFTHLSQYGTTTGHLLRITCHSEFQAIFLCSPDSYAYWSSSF